MYGHLIEETRQVLNSLHKWKVNNVRQNLNGAAHYLAKKALSINEEHGLSEEVP